ncbi:hypothetical protein HDV00_005895 [Rhizophlyctis rosea]|nr:hypothetical protein HDV00_005895 [Rhizophlyctis rosea]
MRKVQRKLFPSFLPRPATATTPVKPSAPTRTLTSTLPTVEESRESIESGDTAVQDDSGYVEEKSGLRRDGEEGTFGRVSFVDGEEGTRKESCEFVELEKEDGDMKGVKKDEEEDKGAEEVGSPEKEEKEVEAGPEPDTAEGKAAEADEAKQGEAVKVTDEPKEEHAKPSVITAPETKKEDKEIQVAIASVEEAVVGVIEKEAEPTNSSDAIKESAATPAPSNNQEQVIEPKSNDSAPPAPIALTPHTSGDTPPPPTPILLTPREPPIPIQDTKPVSSAWDKVRYALATDQLVPKEFIDTDVILDVPCVKPTTAANAVNGDMSSEKKLEALTEHIGRDAVTKRYLILMEVQDLCAKLESLDRQRCKIIKGEEKARKKIALQLVKLRAEEATLRNSLDGTDHLRTKTTVDDVSPVSSSSSSGSLSGYSFDLDDEMGTRTTDIKGKTPITLLQTDLCSSPSTESVVSYPLPAVPRSSMETEHERMTLLAAIKAHLLNQQQEKEQTSPPRHSRLRRRSFIPTRTGVDLPIKERRKLPWDSSVDDVDGNKNSDNNVTRAGRRDIFERIFASATPTTAAEPTAAMTPDVPLRRTSTPIRNPGWIWNPTKQSFRALSGVGNDTYDAIVAAQQHQKATRTESPVKRVMTFSGWRRRAVAVRLPWRRRTVSGALTGSDDGGGMVVRRERRPRWLRVLMGV